jgi:diguanylate cyclase (GGDEF)-like protein
MSQTVATLRAAEAELQRSVRHDALTGLSNRRFFLETFSKTLSQSVRAGSPLALLFVDLDGFKAINDQLGHQAGDAVLRAVGQRLLQSVRSADAVARIGGDEFTILIHNPARADDAARIAEKVLETVGRPFVLPEGSVQVTASVGISLFPEDGSDAESLLRHADLAMYRAKEEGRNTCRFFTPALSEQARARLEIETDLRGALELEQLRLYYQPVVDVEARPVGLEALLRWSHPSHGLLRPERFIGPAAESGLLVSIGDWVLGEACRVLRELDEPRLRVSVNISPRECSHPGLIERVRSGLGAAGLDPARLELELSGGAPAVEASRVAGLLRRIRALGVSLSFDDFGSASVAPAWLRSAGFDRLKLDPALVANLPRDRDARAVAAAILAMSRALELDVVAEGVETREQLAALRELGFELFQGHLFGAAMPREPLRRWLFNNAEREH